MSFKKMNDEQMLDDLKTLFGVEFTAADVRGFCASRNISYPTVTKRLDPYKVGRGKWNLKITPQKIEQMERAYQDTSTFSENLIPEKDSNFIRFGNFADIRKIIESRLFYPTFITGLSGNGKTLSVEQACAQLGREMIRVNITIETDETDLIGSHGLINGETVWKDGPVIEAMNRGAILLLDECLEENEEVLVGTVENHRPMRLSEMEYNTDYPIVSFNMETGDLENDTGRIISDKEDEIYEVELENGKTIRMNAKHPFIVLDENGCYVEKTIESGLSSNDLVVSYDEETMICQLPAVKQIRPLGSGKVRNLTVYKNHTFLTANGIVTHNCDLGSNKLLALQPVLEGKGIYLKKVNRFVSPTPGFNVFATANTKGKGSDDGRFIGTNILNSAFLDRFAITLEQDYPTTAIEIKILRSVAHSIGLNDSDEFIKILCDWSTSIRKTFFDGGVDEIISTRRLVHILKSYSIFKNKLKAIKYSISGFDDETKTAFLELYDKYDSEFEKESAITTECPF